MTKNEKNKRMENKYKLWVARDKSDELFAYASKPEREYYLGFWYSDLNCVGSISRAFFPDLTWEDEPIEVELRPATTELDTKAHEYANSVTDNEELREMIVNAFKVGYNI